MCISVRCSVKQFVVEQVLQSLVCKDDGAIRVKSI